VIEVELPTGTVTLLFTDIEGSTQGGPVQRQLRGCLPQPQRHRPVVFSGTPADLVANGDTLTAQHLRAYLEEA
jgi:hypothetical protein